MSLVLKIVSVESRIDQSKSCSQEMTMSMQSEKAVKNLQFMNSQTIQFIPQQESTDSKQ